jgi:protocatechuate 3,4-dioxygenase beta subunit
MLQRRDVLKSLGAGVGLTGASLAALLYRVERIDQPLLYPVGEIGADVAVGLEPTLHAHNGVVTRQQTEGPFYTPNTPHRRDIRDASQREPAFILSGRMLDPRGKPIPGAVIDFWQVDQFVRYDNHGYRYRGHQFTDSQGRYQLITVRPRAYSAMGVSRTPHIHLKAKGPSSRVLTSQLYLPDEQAGNARDRIFHPSLVMAYTRGDGPGPEAQFDLVLADA